MAHMTRRSAVKTIAGVSVGAGLLPLPALAAGDTLKIGYVSPITGPFAPFAEADHFMLGQVREALKNGLTINGKTYAVEIIDVDDQSDPNRASTLAQQLINRDGVHLMLAQGALTIGNVSAQCEAAGVPCITTQNPWQAWMFPLGSSPDVGFEYINHFFWGIEDIISTYIGMWDGLDTNRRIGTCFTNDPPGQTFAHPEIGFPPALKAAGFETVDIGLFQPGSNDFTAQIAAFRDAECDIVTGLFDPPDWVVFWRQAQQAGFKPKVATVAKALLFPAGIQALGQSADGMSTEIWWTPSYPYRSSITGQTAGELAAAYEAATGRTWTQPIGVVHALLETGIAALSGAADPTDPDAVQDTIRNMSLDTVVGNINWAASPIKNVAKMAIAGGQWNVSADGTFDLAVTYNEQLPEVPIQQSLRFLP